MDLGITGYDQVQEHDAGVRALAAAAGMSAESRDAADKLQGCETVMDLGFGHCKLQVQVPAKGAYATTEDLVGKNIGTSFVRLAEEHFAKLEAKEQFAKLEAEKNGVTNGEVTARNLRTKIIELSGSVEAACALGVADGIVDLVGTLPPSCTPFLLPSGWSPVLLAN